MEYFVSLISRDKNGEAKKGKSSDKRKMEFLKSQKRRRKSLDETLFNPIKSLMGITRSPKRNTYVCDETTLIQTYLSSGRSYHKGSDNETLKKQLEDPFVHKRSEHSLRRNFSYDEVACSVNRHSDDVTNSVYTDITNLVKVDETCREKTDSDVSKTKEMKDSKLENRLKDDNNSVNRSNSLKERKQVFCPGDLTKTEKKAGQRRRKSENEFFRLIRESSFDKIRNAVRRSSSLKEKNNVEQQEPKEPIHLSSININTRFKSKHIRTKSASETEYSHARVQRSSSLLANPLLKDTTDTLYNKSKKKKVERTRSASESEPLEPDTTIKERLRNAVGRSSSLKESREAYQSQVHVDSSSDSDRSIKSLLKNAIKKSSSFKDTKRPSDEVCVRHRAGSESEVFISNKSVTGRFKNEIKRSSSLKESKESLQTDEEGIARNPIKRSSSAKEKINKRILPSIVRRISRTKNRKDADTDESNNDDENTGSDFDISRYSPTSSHNGSDDKISIRSNHSPLLRTKNEIYHRDEVIRRAVSRSNSLQRKFDRLNCAKAEIDGVNDDNFQPPVVTSRSMSVGDALIDLKPENKPKSASVHRQFSLREDRSNCLNNSTASAVIFHTSRERLDNPSTFDNRNDWLNRSLNKKRKIFPPFRNTRRRSVGVEESPDLKKLSKLDNVKLELLLGEILHEKMKNVEYEHRSSNERCRVLSTNIEATIKERIDEGQEYKIVALVYIAETRDHGVNFATQCFHEPKQDLFATATYHNGNMFICACALASRLLPETLPQIIK